MKVRKRSPPYHYRASPSPSRSTSISNLSSVLSSQTTDDAESDSEDTVPLSAFEALRTRAIGLQKQVADLETALRISNMVGVKRSESLERRAEGKEGRIESVLLDLGVDVVSLLRFQLLGLMLEVGLDTRTARRRSSSRLRSSISLSAHTATVRCRIVPGAETGKIEGTRARPGETRTGSILTRGARSTGLACRSSPP